jgi:hypothetical protein
MDPSLKMMFTTYCCVVPLGIEVVGDVRVMDSATAAVTKTVVVVVSPLALAVMVTGLPLLFDTPVTRSVFGSTDATVGSEDDQLAFVIVCVVLSL